MSISRLAAALLLLSSSCTRWAEEKSRPDLPALVGASEADVVQRLGTPDRRFNTGNLRYLVYEHADVWRAPRAQAVSFPCRITFILETGRVRSFDQQGAGCT